MAPIRKMFGFREINYLYSAYLQAPATDEIRKMTEEILLSFPEKIRANFPDSAEKKLLGILENLGLAERFGSYAVIGMLYVYCDINGAGGYNPVKRVSFETSICKEPEKKKKCIGPTDSLSFHVNIRGRDLFKELGNTFYNYGCSEELWHMRIPEEKIFEPISLEKGIDYIENVFKKYPAAITSN